MVKAASTDYVCTYVVYLITISFPSIKIFLKLKTVILLKFSVFIKKIIILFKRFPVFVFVDQKITVSGVKRFYPLVVLIFNITLALPAELPSPAIYITVKHNITITSFFIIISIRTSFISSSAFYTFIRKHSHYII